MLKTTSLFQNRTHAFIITEVVLNVKLFDITVAEIRCADPGYGKHVVRTGTSFMYQSEVSDFVDRFNVRLTAPPGLGVLKIIYGTNTCIKGQCSRKAGTQSKSPSGYLCIAKGR